MLEELGFVLDLISCVVSGGRDDLIYILFKFGWVVSCSGVGEWVDRMLMLWFVMCGEGDVMGVEIVSVLVMMGYFIEYKLFKLLGDGLFLVVRD